VTAPTATPGIPPRPWPDNPMWHHSQAAGHWTPPLPCDHQDDPVFGPGTCTCHDQT
jgi:hypothetical protein